LLETTSIYLYLYYIPSNYSIAKKILIQYPQGKEEQWFLLHLSIHFLSTLFHHRLTVNHSDSFPLQYRQYSHALKLPEHKKEYRSNGDFFSKSPFHLSHQRNTLHL